MKNTLKFYTIVILMFSISTSAFAHEGHHHLASTDTVKKAMSMADTSKLSVDKVVTLKGDTFSTFHPLIVHFPIVLLIVAALLQIAGLFYTKNNWDIITLFLLAGGTLGAYLSGSYFHPHTEGLPLSASEILNRHEFYALLTVLSSAAALVLKLVAVFIIKSKRRLLEIVIAIILLFSAVSVSFAGHWGAYLTHIEGVGPQGKFIENE